MTDHALLNRLILLKVSPGELLDRLSILKLKESRVTDPAKLENVRAELHIVKDAWEDSVYSIRVSAEILRLCRELDAANTTIWDCEDEIRQPVGAVKVAAAALSARAANNHRASLKRLINMELDCTLMEEKSYDQGGRDGRDANE